MAELLNNKPVLGVVNITDGRTLYNGLRVLGVRVSAEVFTDDQVVTGVNVLADGETLHNDQRVVGVSLVVDDREIQNDQRVLPITVLSGSLA